MPFHGHLQYQNALLVESSSFVVKNAAYTANSGDVVICNSTASTAGGSSGTIVVTLPAVGQGGPVTVINQNSTTLGGTVYVVTADGSYIDGTAATAASTIALISPNVYGTAAADIGLRARSTFSSDGTNWWRVA